MHVKSIRLKSFRGFHSLSISGISDQVRMVILTGPNGSGKSSVLEAFNEWTKERGRGGVHDLEYFARKGSTRYEPRNNVVIDFWECTEESHQYTSRDFSKAVYIRSAYRNDPDFAMREIWHQGQEHDLPNVERLIENDVRVAKNYNRLISRTMAKLYDKGDEEQPKRELKDQLVGPIRDSILKVFDDLVFEGVGDPTVDGTFLFSKGDVENFAYKNLSGGEKAAFDLLLDLHLARDSFQDSVFCIDEPEAHMGTKTQSRLLEELYHSVPNNTQLWIATHSVGMVRKASEIDKLYPGSVVFLDFSDVKLDSEVEIRPATTNRKFWSGVFSQSLDDLSELIAPRMIVMCEGETRVDGTGKEIKGFDSKCYSQIFAEQYPDVAFISVGNSDEVQNDRLSLVQAVELLNSGSEVVKLIDRDEMNEEDIQSLPTGTKVLSKRHIESYLLDLELLKKLCIRENRLDLYPEIELAYEQEFESLKTRDKLDDDAKSAAPGLVTKIKKILRLKRGGQKYTSFLVENIVPLITPDTGVYAQLKKDIFES